MFCSVTTFDRVSMKGGKWVYCVLIVILNFTRHDVCKGMFGSLVVSFLMPFCYPLGECILAITCNIAGSFAQFLKQFRSHLRGYFSTTCTLLFYHFRVQNWEVITFFWDVTTIKCFFFSTFRFTNFAHRRSKTFSLFFIHYLPFIVLCLDIQRGK